MTRDDFEQLAEVLRRTLRADLKSGDAKRVADSPLRLILRAVQTKSSGNPRYAKLGKMLFPYSSWYGVKFYRDSGDPDGHNAREEISKEVGDYISEAIDGAAKKFVPALLNCLWDHENRLDILGFAPIHKEDEMSLRQWRIGFIDQLERNLGNNHSTNAGGKQAPSVPERLVDSRFRSVSASRAERAADRIQFIKYLPSLIAMIHRFSFIISMMRWQVSSYKLKLHGRPWHINIGAVVAMLDPEIMNSIRDVDALGHDHDVALDRFQTYVSPALRVHCVLLSNEVNKLRVISNEIYRILSKGDGVVPDNIVFDSGLFVEAFTFIADGSGFGKEELDDLLEITRYRRTVEQKACCPMPMNQANLALDIVELSDLELKDGAAIYYSFFDSAYTSRSFRGIREKNLANVSNPILARQIIGLAYCAQFLQWNNVQREMVDYSGENGPSLARNNLYEGYLRTYFKAAIDELSNGEIISPETKGHWDELISCEDFEILLLFDAETGFTHKTHSISVSEYEVSLRWQDIFHAPPQKFR